MRHERIPIEQKLANDAQCRPATPAFEGALMGTARSSGNGKTGTTAGFDPSSPQDGHHGGNDMDWLMGGGGLDDPLSSLMTLEQEGNSSGGHFNLGDDLFGMPAANPSGMGGGYGQHQGSLGMVKEEPHALFHGAQEGNGDSYAGHAHHRQDNSSGSSDQSTSTDLINGRGHSVNGRASINQNQYQTGGQNQNQNQMRSFEAGLQLREETVLTRPFAQSALRQAQLQRYRAKRLARHLGHKKIRYECRKTLADNRPRIKGRFAKVNSDADLAGMVTAQSCPDLSAMHRAAKLDEERAKDSSSTKKDSTEVKAEPRRSRLSDGSDDTVANAKQSGGSPKKASPNGKGGKKATASAAEEVFKKVGSLRSGGKPVMPYTQSEVSLVALDREGVW
uniref:CCT domain-containing protein n=2 Tax=Micromonas pusilla TaxID=38833 RepID=A0A7S0KC36_MICPS|mmetsp:Transcript_11072/g.43064  ORF Transcript_11072/g.43064 Transcript_11072/m.43064 type:complete len:391 (+) Transcript_11072:351-1523(+)